MFLAHGGRYSELGQAEMLFSMCCRGSLSETCTQVVVKDILSMIIHPNVQSILSKQPFFFFSIIITWKKAHGLNVSYIGGLLLNHSDHRINVKTLWSSTCGWWSEFHGHSWSLMCVSIIMRSTVQINWFNVHMFCLSQNGSLWFKPDNIQLCFHVGKEYNVTSYKPTSTSKITTTTWMWAVWAVTAEQYLSCKNDNKYNNMIK